ncbi:uncharacterized protein Dvir_GJ15373, isoform B [Drosophila virilis]|uniref:Uncharacterized protein, isoform B n=1 Tax=Drosophila virilis TaxID=7244 RepID=A0A0Q9VZ86_DROVI|nr:uncharacterized protein Dvir_GJ15373, isoform B [Drosophila virilis]
MPETLPATATVSASSIDCTVAVLKVPTPTMQLPQPCNLQSLGLIMEPNNINIELNPAATTSGFKGLAACSQIKSSRSRIIISSEMCLSSWLVNRQESNQSEVQNNKWLNGNNNNNNNNKGHSIACNPVTKVHVKYKKLHFCQLIRNVTMVAARPFRALRRVCHLIKKRHSQMNKWIFVYS